MKIGAACKWLDANTGEVVPSMNFRVMTVRTAMGLDKRELRERLADIVQHNLQALTQVVLALCKLPESVRMWRIGSDLLPLATHPVAQEFYRSQIVESSIKELLKTVGAAARLQNVRLSFHPGQFVVLGSPNPMARAASVREFEYHARCARWMGYTKWHQDGFAINVHVGGKQVDPRVFIKTLKGMSETAQNLITLENDEFSWGARAIVEHFGEHVALVPDVHHYWIERGKRMKSRGKHIELIKQTWRGVRPKLHLAMSYSKLIPKNMWHGPLDLDQLLELGQTKGALRAHSDAPWHRETLDYVRPFLDDFDVMWEGKDKNLGQLFIAQYYGLL